MIGFQENRANELRVEDGKLTGEVREPILGRATKLATLIELTESFDLDDIDTLVVGDGANDLGMIQHAGLGVAYHAKPAVAAAAAARIDHGDLTALLYLQGVSAGRVCDGLKCASDRDKHPAAKGGHRTSLREPVPSTARYHPCTALGYEAFNCLFAAALSRSFRPKQRDGDHSGEPGQPTIRHVCNCGERPIAGHRDGLPAHREQSSHRNCWIHVRPREQRARNAAKLMTRAQAGEDLPLLGDSFGVKDNIDVGGNADDRRLSGIQLCTVALRRQCRAADRSRSDLSRQDQSRSVCYRSVGCAFALRVLRDRWPMPRFVSGGSSSGSAVAVAAGHVVFALGTDTGGSGRIPAGFNEVVGIKPTIGLVSSRGLVPNCPTIDCVSIFLQQCPGRRKRYSMSLKGLTRRTPTAVLPRGRPRRPGPATAFRFGRIPADGYRMLRHAGMRRAL